VKHTFERIAMKWLDHWKCDKSSQHVDTVCRRLTANVFPFIGKRPITEIEPNEIASLARQIEARGVSDLAKRILQTIGQIFRFAIAHDFCKRNPTSEIRPADILKPTQ